MPPGMKVNKASAPDVDIRANSNVVATSLIVRRQDKDVFKPLLIGDHAADFGVLVVLIGGHEEMGMAVFPRECRGARIGADQECLGFHDRLENRLKHVGKDGANYEVDLIFFHQRGRLQEGNILYPSAWKRPQHWPLFSSLKSSSYSQSFVGFVSPVVSCQRRVLPAPLFLPFSPCCKAGQLSVATFAARFPQSSDAGPAHSGKAPRAGAMRAQSDRRRTVRPK